MDRSQKRIMIGLWVNEPNTMKSYISLRDQNLEKSITKTQELDGTLIFLLFLLFSLLKLFSKAPT